MGAMSETDVFLGPSTDEGHSLNVIRRIDDSEDRYSPTVINYHISGVESVTIDTPMDIGPTAKEGLNHIDLVNGKRVELQGNIADIKL